MAHDPIDFPDEGRAVRGPIADPLGVVLPALDGWELVRNDVGAERFALHGRPVPIRTYTYTTTIDRIHVASTVLVYWMRPAIADGRDLAARFALAWVSDAPRDDGSWVTELRRELDGRTLFAFVAPGVEGSSVVVLSGDAPPEDVGYELGEDDEAEEDEPDEDAIEQALSEVTDPSPVIAESARRSTPRADALPRRDSRPLGT